MVFTSNLYKKAIICIISLTLCGCVVSEQKPVTDSTADFNEALNSISQSENVATLNTESENDATSDTIYQEKSISDFQYSNETEDTTENTQLYPFEFNYHFTYDNDKYTEILFEDEDLKYKLDLASWLKFEYVDRAYPPDFSLSQENTVEYIKDGINGLPYCRTNIDYSSFMNKFKECFTDKCIDELFKEKENQYINDNGVLIVGDVAGLPTSPCTKELTFDISEHTDEELILHCNAKIYHPDATDIIGYYDYYFTLVMSEQGWKFDSFDNAWLYSSATYDFKLAD